MPATTQHEVKQIPLFPLKTILFPDGVISLKIFEARYLDMIKNCLKNQSSFGVIGVLNDLSDTSVNKSGIVRMAEFGTLAKIEEFDPVEPALYMTQSFGSQRFKLISTEQMKDGLWMGQIELLQHDPEMPVPDELTATAGLLSKIITAINAEFNGTSRNNRPFKPPFKFDDCGWVSNRFAEILPISMAEKIHLLSLTNPRIRLDLISEIIAEGGLKNIIIH